MLLGKRAMQSQAKYSKLPTEECAIDMYRPSAMGEDFFKSEIEYESIYSFGSGSNGFDNGFVYPGKNGHVKRLWQRQAHKVSRDSPNGLDGVPRVIVETGAILFSYFVIAITLPFSLILCLKFVKDCERLVLFRLGRLQDAKGPGAVVVLPCIDAWKRVDMRTKAFNIPPIQAVTYDGGVLELGAQVYYCVRDALSMVTSVQDCNQSMRTLAHTMLHRQVNKKHLSDITTNKPKLAWELQAELNASIRAWGLEIKEVELSEHKIVKESNQPGMDVLKQLTRPEVAGQLWQSIATGITNTNGSTFQPIKLDPLIEPQAASAAAQAPPPTATDGGGSGVVPGAPAEFNLDLHKLVSTLNSIACSELVAEVGNMYVINCTGLGDFYLDLKNGAGRAAIGPPPDGAPPDVRIQLSENDLRDLLFGQLEPLQAYLKGNLQIQGNTSAALKLQCLASYVNQKYGSGSTGV